MTDQGGDIALAWNLFWVQRVALDPSLTQPYWNASESSFYFIRYSLLFSSVLLFVPGFLDFEWCGCLFVWPGGLAGLLGTYLFCLVWALPAFLPSLLWQLEVGAPPLALLHYWLEQNFPLNKFWLPIEINDQHLGFVCWHNWLFKL